MPGRTTSPLEVETYAESIRRQLAPRNPAESLIVGHAVRAAVDAAEHLERADEADAHRSIAAFKVALEALDLLRNLATEAGAFPRIAPTADRPATGNEWPIVPGEAFDDEPVRGRVVEVIVDVVEDLDADADEPPIWAGRLVYDFDVSDESPVVKGTWITVRHVVSLIIDGATWADILRAHPELTEEDIRVCVAYTVAEDDGMA